jgi:carotenoid cleavage dioxygenase-like enzyme
MSNKNKFYLGFSTLEQEIIIEQLPTQGTFPNWLKGSLFRNGAAKFEVGEQQYRHWFDGLAMLHKFSFNQGQVSYINRFLQSETYCKTMEAVKICVSEFATAPSRSFWQGVGSLLSLEISDNANLNITQIAGRLMAITGTPYPVEFDPQSLRTIGKFYYTDKLPGLLTTGHPHRDLENQELVNFLTQFSQSSTYNVYRLPFGQTQRRLIGSIPVDEPAYIHSFALTKNYVILAEPPLVTNPINLITQNIKGKPFIENFSWKPEKGSRFLVMRKDDGKMVRSYEILAFFALNQANAFESEDEIIMDLPVYERPNIYDYYLHHLRNEEGCKLSKAEFRRYRIPLYGKSVTYELLSDQIIEFPQINIQKCHTKEYQFVYGVSLRQEHPNEFFNQLLKLDIFSQKTDRWFEDSCYPGEPIFVPNPNAEREDEGVILSVVLDGNKKNSFLLILDGQSFAEIARAELPHCIPFGTHGQYFPVL